MHLLNITNTDYGLMTILFALILVVAYYFRRRNPTSNDFLLANGHKISPVVSYISLSGVGLVEFLLVSSYGAYAGLAALILVAPIFWVMSWYLDRQVQNSLLLRSLKEAQASTLTNRFNLICYALIMLLVSGVAIAIIVSLLFNLLGWQFGNSTLSLMAIILICLLLGGVIGVYYNQALVSLVVSLSVIAVLGIGCAGIGYGNLVSNLQTAALHNHLPASNFILPQLSQSLITQIWLVVVSCAVIVVVNPLQWLKKVKLGAANATGKKNFSRILQLIVIALFVLLGVFALATPNQSSLADGQKIVTQQTRLSDGSIGYVVKLATSAESSTQIGILPQQMNDDNQLASFDSSQNVNDYISAAMVVVKHSLPMAFVSLFILIGLFFKTMCESVSFIVIALIRGIYAPFYNKSGEDLENLWAARVFTFAVVAVAIAVGLVIYKFYDLYFGLSLLLVFSFPLALNLCGLSKSWLVDAITYLSLLVTILCVNLGNVASLFALVKFNNLVDFVLYSTLSSMVFYLLTFILFSLFQKKKEL